MKIFNLIMIVSVLIPALSLAQDSIPKPSSYDEGYFFVGADDLLKFKGYAQFDGYFPLGKSIGKNEFMVRRARFAATGFFQKKFRYMIDASFDRGKAELRKAFLESRHLNFAKIRIGQFKVPFSPTNLQSDAQINFISRSYIVENFAPSYDIGAMLFGDGIKKHLNYAFGVFNGRTGLNDPENNNSKFLVGRVELSPFISAKESIFKKLFIGASLANGNQKEGIGGESYKLSAGAPVFTFNADVKQDGKTTVYGYDLAWYHGSFSTRAEYLNFKAEGLNENDFNFKLSSHGYQISATFLVTGEEKNRNEIIKPKKEVDPKNGNFGAFELAIRYEQANLSSSLPVSNFSNGATKLNSFASGVNWYLNDDVKVVLNYSKYVFGDEVKSESILYKKSDYLIGRVQFQF